MDEPKTFTAFVGRNRISVGTLRDAALAAKAAEDRGERPIMIFDDQTGRTVELDLRGAPDEVAARLPAGDESPAKPARGRPKLGVTAREVTLLPRQWEWLATQPGGASAALRRLVDQARRDNLGADHARQALETAHRVMTTLAGDLPDYEDAMRALYAKDYRGFERLTAPWPSDVGDYVRRLVAIIEDRQTT